MAPASFRDALAAQDGGRHIATSPKCRIVLPRLFRRLNFIFNGLSFQILINFILINSDPILRDGLHLIRKIVEEVQRLAAASFHFLEEVLGEALDLPENVLVKSIN